MWIARDKDGSLFLYDAKPVKRRDYFDSPRGFNSIELNSYMFIEVTFENSPQEIKLKLVNNV